VSSSLNKNYIYTLNSLKEKIKQSRLRASLTVNTQLLQLYWEIGNTIFHHEKKEGWGAKIVATLAKDLKTEFPDMKGLSPRNLRYMRDFAVAYPGFSILQGALAKLKPRSSAPDENLQAPLAKLPATSIMQAPLAQLSWYHHITLLDKIKDPATRSFYIEKAVKNGWSRDIMVLQIESNLHKRQGKAITNFDNTLPPAQSDLAKETLKNPYLFDFLSIGEEMQEREMEKALVQHIKNFLLELGRGFAYVGNQFNIPVEDDDYFLDLLFYNYHLHCFVVFELKVGKFKPEYAGKLNFYINTVDEQIKGRDDKTTIGVLLCKTPNHTTVKYALKGIKTPMGVADYEFAKALTGKIKTELPSIEELEAALESEARKFTRKKQAAKPASNFSKKIKQAKTKKP
jgi:predicted nuclease of restriction endonuclease-like (RecB) superfamily